jgi:large subunit ribosomal protein L4
MLVDIYNEKGEKIKQAKLPKEIFGVEVNPNLVYQVVTSQMSNRRQGTAHTKDRSEVRGGGRKPWAQKGTGRARHGSIRSPIWKGGGVTFGPRKERNFRKSIPKKMKRKALFMVLSGKVKENLLILLDKLEVKEGKTKELANLLKNLPCKGGSVLIALPKYDKKIIQSSNNLPEVRTMEARELNALDLLSYKYLLMPKDALKVIKETFLKTN